MHVDDLILISVDDHLVEPPSLFDHHLAAKYRDRAPHVVHTNDGGDVWGFGDAVIPNVGLHAVAGRPQDEYGVDPTSRDEMRRVAAKGCHSLTFTENPLPLGFPSYHDEYWDPLWTAARDLDMVISVHLGSSGQLVVTAPNAPVDVMITLQPMNISTAAADILWLRVIKQFPDIRFALIEGGTGWIPYFLERVDRTYAMHRAWTGQDFGDKLPSEVFREHFLTCFIDDPVGIQMRHMIGIDNICWELDYPHSDSSWPTPGEHLLTVATGVSDEDLDKMTYENAMRWYSFDPFAHRAKERCTVAALRAESPGHDVSIRSMDTRHQHGHGTDLGVLAANATA